MPLVKVELLKGKSKEYKKGIMDGIHEALVTAFKIPDNDRMQRLYELDRENFEFSSNKSEDCIIIELTVFEGRSMEAKELLYKEIVKNLKRNSGVNEKDVLIVINEPPLCNWGVNGGVPASKCNLGFDIKV